VFVFNVEVDKGLVIDRLFVSVPAVDWVFVAVPVKVVRVPEPVAGELLAVGFEVD
jgi:hypothetical protein